MKSLKQILTAILFLTCLTSCLKQKDETAGWSESKNYYNQCSAGQ